MDEGRLMEFLHRFVVDFGVTGAANVLAGTWMIVEPRAGDGVSDNCFRRAAETPFNLVFEARP
jgi:hypothetical protein